MEVANQHTAASAHLVLNATTTWLAFSGDRALKNPVVYLPFSSETRHYVFSSGGGYAKKNMRWWWLDPVIRRAYDDDDRILHVIRPMAFSSVESILDSDSQTPNLLHLCGQACDVAVGHHDLWATRGDGGISLGWSRFVEWPVERPG